MVLSWIVVKLKSLVFSMPRFALSYVAGLQVTPLLHGVSIGADRMEIAASNNYYIFACFTAVA
jgi:hypothetical protein